MNSRSSKSTNNASDPARKDGAFSCLFCHQVPRHHPNHALGPGLAVPARLVHIQARGRWHRPEHVQEGELHRQCHHRAALRPRQGRVLPGPRVEDIRGFQTRPGGIHSPLEHEPEADKIEGPDPEGVPESGPRGLVAIKGFQDLGRSSQPARAFLLKETGPVPQGNRARSSHGASDRNRTCNPLITNQLRYRCATLAHLALSREAC